MKQENIYMVKFAGLLAEKGYGSVPVKPEEISVFYKQENGFTQVVVSIDYHEGFILESTQMSGMKQHIEQLFHEQQKSDVQSFFVFWGMQRDGIRELVQEDNDFWFADIEQRQLVLYENQRSDFYGIRVLVEAALEVSVSQDSEMKWYGKRNEGGLNLMQYAFMNLLIILANIVVFVILEWLGDTEEAAFMLAHGGMYPDSVLIDHQWYRLFTCMFIHFGVAHLGNNMLILFFMGDKLEKAVGKIKYILIYFISGLGGSLLSLSYMVKTGDFAVSGGASGAIFGVIGALIYIVIRNKGKLKDLTARRLIFMAALSLYYGFTASGVDNYAHLGGITAGFLAAVILYRK